MIVFEGAVEPNENGMLFGSFDKHVHLKDLVFDIDNTEIEKSIDEATEKLNEKLQKEGRSPLY